MLSVNQVIRKFADDDRVVWIDFGHDFLDAQGLIQADLMPDFLHLSPDGYEIWARNIESTLSRIIGDQQVSSDGPDHPLAGDWTWTINGPDGLPISAPLKITVEGDRVVARFARDETRWLESENGRLNGDSFTWTARRP